MKIPFIKKKSFKLVKWGNRGIAPEDYAIDGYIPNCKHNIFTLYLRDESYNRKRPVLYCWGDNPIEGRFRRYEFSTEEEAKEYAEILALKFIFGAHLNAIKTGT